VVRVAARRLPLAFRQIRKSPIFTVVAAFTLALGIGSGTAIFSAIGGTLLHPYPYKNPGRLVTIRCFSADQFRAWRFPARAFVDFKERNHTFEDMFGLVYREVHFTRASGTEEGVTVCCTPLGPMATISPVRQSS
jgi:hypothetical protein